MSDSNAKDEVRALLDRLADDVELEDVLYELYVYVRIKEGLAAADAGETIPHEEVERELRARWLHHVG